MNEYLNKKVENKLISLGNKRYRKTLILTLAWIYLVIVFFVLFIIFGSFLIMMSSSFLKPFTLPFLIR